MIVYIVMKAILWLGQPWTIIPAGYAGKTTALFCLTYLISLAIVAWWRHFRLIIYRSKRMGSSGTPNEGQKSQQTAGLAKKCSTSS